MNAGTKYLMDSIAGLVMEVATLRTQNEAYAAQIAELSRPVPEDGGHDLGPSPTATFDEHGQATP